MNICIICVYLLLIKLSDEMEIDLRLSTIPQSYKLNSKFYIDNEYRYLIPLCLGTPPQCFNVFYEVNFTHLVIIQLFFILIIFSDLITKNHLLHKILLLSYNLIELKVTHGKIHLLLNVLKILLTGFFGSEHSKPKLFLMGNLVLGEIIQILVKNIMKSIVL